MWAITEQLIDMPRAIAIQRRMIARFGRRHGVWRDAPSAAAIADCAPAELEACGLAGKRALAMRRAAREVASGRVALAPAARPAEPPRRARAAVSGSRIARRARRAWDRAASPRPRPPPLASPRPPTRACAPAAADFRPISHGFSPSPRSGRGRSRCSPCTGSGASTSCPRATSAISSSSGGCRPGNPKAIADEAEVRGFFAPYAPWAGLAASHLIRERSRPAPRPARTRWSAAAPRSAAV